MDLEIFVVTIGWVGSEWEHNARAHCTHSGSSILIRAYLSWTGIPYKRKFSPGEKFRQFRHLLLLAKFFIREFLSRVNDYIEDMATFTALVKIYSIKYFCNTKVSGLGKILSSENFHLYGICPCNSGQPAESAKTVLYV